MSDRKIGGMLGKARRVDVFPRAPSASDRPVVFACTAPVPFWQQKGPSWVELTRSCGSCPGCVQARRNSRANDVAQELEVSDWALWLTLTIEPDDDRFTDLLDVMLNIKVMQDFQKRCRIHKDRQVFSFAGIDCTSWRFVQCGEYGRKNGRAHYHAVIFGRGQMPDWPLERNCHIPEWPFGFVKVSADVDRGIAYYLSKYMDKAQGAERCFSSSNCPSLGSDFMIDFAIKSFEMGARNLPRDWRFVFPGVVKNYSGIFRGAKRRDLIINRAWQCGVTVLELMEKHPQHMHAAFRAADKYQRERLQALVPVSELVERMAEELHQSMRLKDIERDYRRVRLMPHMISDREAYLPRAREARERWPIESVVT